MCEETNLRNLTLTREASYTGIGTLWKRLRRVCAPCLRRTAFAAVLLLAAVLLCACAQQKAVRRQDVIPSIRDDKGNLLNPSTTVTVTITRRPTTPPADEKKATPTPVDGATPTTGVPGGYSISSRGYNKKEIVEYFDEIAMRAEYGTSANAVHKWTTPLLIYIDGDPNSEDRKILDDVFYKMNSVDGFPGIREVSSKDASNIVMSFADDVEYTRITPKDINDLTDGFATCWFQNSSIIRARIGIRTSMPQHERNSVIWEELVQCTGLQNDSYRYPESLFYQGYNEVQGPNTLDWLLFEVLYHPDIQPGMRIEEVSTVLDTVLR